MPDVIYTCSDSGEKVSTRSTGIDVKILFDRGLATIPTAAENRSNKRNLSSENARTKADYLEGSDKIPPLGSAMEEKEEAALEAQHSEVDNIHCSATRP